jgi:hypothetical protein
VWWIGAGAAIVVVVALAAGLATWAVRGRPGPGPERLAAAEVTSHSVALSWSPPTEGSVPGNYVVRRDGVDIATIGAEGAYEDTTVRSQADYHYTVVAVVDGKLSRASQEIVVHTPPAPPTALAASDVTTTTITLSWAAPADGTPDQYVVTRDDEVVGTLPPSQSSYTDRGLDPLTPLSYTVAAVVAGEESEPTEALRVTTLGPVDAARLDGTWDVALTVAKNKGTRLTVGEAYPETWELTPGCATGACAVTLSGTIGGTGFTAKLTRKGAVYTGSARAAVMSCRGATTSNTLTVTLTVTEGEMLDSSWLASNWKGSLVLAVPYTRAGSYYCPSQSATFSVTPQDVTTAAAPPEPPPATT